METTPEIDSKEDATEENKSPSDPRIEEPEEQKPQELTEEPTEEPQEETEEPARDSDREEQTEETARVSHEIDREPEENVEATDEVPEMDDRRAMQSRERSIGKSDSAMKVSGRSSPEITGRSVKVMGSRARMVVGDVIDIRRSSMAGDVSDRKTTRYMNSYVLASENPFNPEKVIMILRAVMEEALVNLPYDPHSCVKQAKWASAAIRSKVKQLNFDRYKIVSVVTIGEKHSQDFYSTCRFLWDTEKDRYTSYALENTYVFGVGLCFGMYYE